MARDLILNFDWGAKNISNKIEQLQNEILLKTTVAKCTNTYGDSVRQKSYVINKKSDD